MQRDLKIGSVSWINEKPSPIWFSGKAAALEPDWVPKTYMGLVATANQPPAASIADFATFRKGKDFRALMYCHLRVTIDDRSQQITTIEVLDAVHHPGWTPPFRVRDYPLSGLKFWDKDIWSFDWHAGEASPISVVRTEARHPNSAITTIPGGEKVLVNGLIKFRAGPNTDRIGVGASVGCPFHVPWVWCEMALTYDGSRFNLYGRGSIFPTHCWYLDGVKVATQNQVGDLTFPSAPTTVFPPPSLPFNVPRISIPHPLTINVTALRLYPVLSKGAPASGAQIPLASDAGRTGAVDTHPNTVSGGAIVKRP
jgi:hypothetical protein